MMEFLDKSFLDVHEASTYLNVPLLGAISKIKTDESIREQRLRAIKSSILDGHGRGIDDQPDDHVCQHTHLLKVKVYVQ